MKKFLKIFIILEILLFAYIFNSSIYNIYEKNNIAADNLSGYVIEETSPVLGSGEINHSGSGENRQFWSNENHQSGVASPQVVLFTRPAAGQPVSQQKYARQPSPASCPGSSPP